MIELLLQAERALSMGLVDEAERLYAQAVAADPRNSIAVVGLARVALERADDGLAHRLATQALAIDPENVAAARLARRIEEVYATRGLPVPTRADGAPPLAPSPSAAPPRPPSPPPPPSPVGPPASPAASAGPAAAPPPSGPPRSTATTPDPPSLIERLFRRKRA